MKRVITLIFLSALLFSQEAIAVEFDPWLQGGLRARDLNHRPGTTDLASNDVFAELRLAAKAQLNSNWSYFVDIRGRLNSEDTTLTDDITDTERDGSNDDIAAAELRELWIRYHGITNLPGEHLTLGLQRFREDSGLWWDEDVEAIAWQGDTTRLDWLLAFGKQLDSYRTDADLTQRDSDTRRLLSQLSWDWLPYHAASLRYVTADQAIDSSPVSVLPAAGFNNQLTWVSFTAESEWTERRYPSNWAYRFEWTKLTGDGLLPSDPSDPSSPATKKDIKADAIDLGIRYDLSSKRASFGLTYARGSGGESSNKSESFSQTGIHTNRGRFFGTRQLLYRFNEALRADLTNLEQTAAFVSYQLTERIQGTFMYGRYRKVDSRSPIYVGGLPVDNNPNESDVGVGVDLNITYYPPKRWYVPVNLFRLRAGHFSPGNGLSDQESDYRITIEAQVRY